MPTYLLNIKLQLAQQHAAKRLIVMGRSWVEGWRYCCTQNVQAPAGATARTQAGDHPWWGVPGARGGVPAEGQAPKQVTMVGRSLL